MYKWVCPYLFISKFRERKLIYFHRLDLISAKKTLAFDIQKRWRNFLCPVLDQIFGLRPNEVNGDRQENSPCSSQTVHK